MTLRLIIYDFFLVLLSPFIALFFLLHALFDSKVREGNLYRLGLKMPPKPGRASVWIHAVSVGEINGIKQFIEFIRIAGRYDIYLSTTTATGFTAAKKTYGDSVTLFYFPFDFPLLPGRILNRIRPEKMIIAEIEIWPNFIAAVTRRNIPLSLINARIGLKELRGYTKARWFFRPFYRCYKHLLAQSAHDKKNMVTIGMPAEDISVSGNVKYDVTYTMDAAKIESTRARIPKGKIVIVAGSTHETEESAIFDAVLKLNRNDIFLVIVPRDISRGAEIRTIAQSRGMAASLFTGSTQDSGTLIVNAIGELIYFYEIADIAIMGGSFSPAVGGHNFLEALYFKKPVIVGPCMHNFRDMDDFFSAENGIIKTASTDSLADSLAGLLADRAHADSVGRHGHDLLMQSRGASERTFKTIFG
ncbi:MAG: 3-deoxy-D-manno-octulosonic acid transferase [Spirochaetes bacterium]|nr:3-deoxy-D-manno-octulosonic acid transferase [Spirochaetota bacterium]